MRALHVFFHSIGILGSQGNKNWTISGGWLRIIISIISILEHIPQSTDLMFSLIHSIFEIPEL